jgi:hypothetical protein
MLACALAVLVAAVPGWLILAGLPALQPVLATIGAASFGQVFWAERGLDALAQLVLLFLAALGVMVLVGPVTVTEHTPREPQAEPAAKAHEVEEVHA